MEVSAVPVSAIATPESTSVLEIVVFDVMPLIAVNVIAGDVSASVSVPNLVVGAVPVSGSLAETVNAPLAAVRYVLSASFRT